VNCTIKGYISEKQKKKAKVADKYRSHLNRIPYCLTPTIEI
jgi:hypothetical protein